MPSGFDAYTKDLKSEDLHRLFTKDTQEAYRFFARHIDFDGLKDLPWHRRTVRHIQLFFVAFTMKMPPARRVVFAVALVLALIGTLNLFQGFGLVRLGLPMPWPFAIIPAIRIPGPVFRAGTVPLLIGFGLVNLLVLLEVADRLSLKNDLEIAREIQRAMLPIGQVTAPGLDAFGLTRPANTVGGDLYDIMPLDDGRVVIALGDVSGKGSPAALLMALALAMFRTLVDERLEPAELVSRLNVQVSRHAPGSRFITFFYAVFTPATGQLIYVNAGHMPPMLVRGAGNCQRLADGGIALGMFDRSTYMTGETILEPGDVLAVYSDGITEAEDSRGRPFDDGGLERVLMSTRTASLQDMGQAVVRAVERHTDDTKFADDLTILLVRRTPTA